MGCTCFYGESDNPSNERQNNLRKINSNVKFEKIDNNEKDGKEINDNEKDKKEEIAEISFNNEKFYEMKNDEKMNNNFFIKMDNKKEKEKDEETNFNNNNFYKHEKDINNNDEKEEKEQKEEKEINIEVEVNKEENINLKSENVIKNDEEKEIKDFEEENNEKEEIGKENADPSILHWREYMKDDNNFNQKVPFDYQDIISKLQKASACPEKLNPFYTISAIYDFTKIFIKISSALSIGFSDITEKSEIMRKRFEDFPEAECIQDLLNKEIELNIHQLNGDNNKSLGHKKDEYSKYISACRTFLRLLWFLEYLTDIFESLLKDDGKGKVKTILGDSYNKVLAPHHTYLVRKAVGMALTFSSAGSVADVVELIFGYKDFNDQAKNIIKQTTDLMKIIWNAGNDFYVKNQLLDLK